MFALLFYLSILTCLSAHNLLLGYPDISSKLIYNKVHQENPALWVRSDTLTINSSSHEVINAIKILDLREDNSGEAYIKAGGIGQRFVVIELDSPTIFRGYNFWVEVYAIQSGAFLIGHGK